MVEIGPRSIVRAGCRIGYEPFSFGRLLDGEQARFPAYGGIKIGPDVEIFHNTSIARGTADDTVIGAYTVVANQAHIGNAVRIGRGCTICAQTDISARTIIEDNVWIAQSAAVRQGLRIGRDAFVGMGAVVVRDVDAGETVTGVPARVMSK